MDLLPGILQSCPSKKMSPTKKAFFPKSRHCNFSERGSVFNKTVALRSSAKEELCIAEFPVSSTAPK